MIRDILVHFDASEAGRNRLRFALALASRATAHLTGTHVRHPAELAPIYKPSKLARAKEDAELDADQSARAAEEMFLRETAACYSVTWHLREGPLVDGLAAEGRVADLIIVGQYEWEGPATHHPLSLAEALVSRSGRPLLVIPERGAVLPNKVLLAWDGSREAVRAVHDALPLLLATDASVEIAWFAERHGSADLDPLREHLTRHGVFVANMVSLNTGSGTAGALLDRINNGQFDLVVMGAFGHPAWFEFLFGGTTAAAMLKSKVPILVSH